MLSKCAGSFLVLLPVLMFAQLQVSSSGPHAAQVPSWPHVGLQGAVPLAHLWTTWPGSGVATSTILVLGQDEHETEVWPSADRMEKPP